MTRSALPVLAVLASSLAIPVQAAPPAGPYQVESGTWEQKTDLMGDVRTVVWFDRYGAREVRRTTVRMGGNVVSETVEIVTPERRVEYDPAKKEGWFTPLGVKATSGKPTAAAPTTLPNGMPMPSVQMGAKPLPPRTVAGKECTGLGMEPVKGMVTRLWTWKGIPMRLESSIGNGVMTVEVIRLEEGAAIPPGAFEVPSDVKLVQR